jgi:hypothetical protein
LYFYGARWYDSYLNRWIQPDSIIPDPYNPQDWDRFAYARNNPVRFNDPTGHWTVETNRPKEEQRRNAYIDAAERAGGNYSGHQREYYSVAAAYYHALASEDYVENIQTEAIILEDKSNNLRINGWNSQSDALSTAWDSAAGPSAIGLSNFGANTVGALAGTTSASALSCVPNIDDIANDVSNWVSQGGGARVIRNSEGDFILINDTNTRQFRFDYYDPSPHQNPHMHLLEWVENRKWEGPRIYPSDVEPR